MPIYEYACGGCGHRFEKLVKRFAEAVACPACESHAVDKQLSVFAVGGTASGARAEPAGCAPGGGCGAAACGGGACGLPS
jgi:putative FmdB family regulatory protein